MRIYVARIPEFNAVMFPTGFTVIFSGLLLRMRNEAQLAGVIAHESGHFLRKHQIRQWRDMRTKTDVFAVLAMGAGVAGGAAGVYTGDLARLAELGTILSLLRYNRTLEAEADAMGVRLIAEAGLRADGDGRDLGPVDRRTRRLGRLPPQEARAADHSLFETHPSPECADGGSAAFGRRSDRAGPRL